MKDLTKKDQHRRSVETLGLSGHSDELIIQQIVNLINKRSPGQPYARNTIHRIKDIVDKHLYGGIEK